MKAKFKGRKKIKLWLFKLIGIFVVIIASFILSFKLLFDNIDIELNNNTYLNYLVGSSFGYYNLADITNLSSTEFLLKYSFGIKEFNSGIDNVTLSTPVTSVVEDDITTNDEPIVYIYNSHQTESYVTNISEEFNINNTVYLGSYILKEYLEDLGISCIVEDNSIVDVLNTNGWKYNSSYKASRILMEQAKKEHPSLKFFIDLHRDAGSYERTTTEIDGIKYAKMMFVVGLKHENYQPNLDLANLLNEKIVAFDDSLSRGVLKKDNAGANGIYNQDFDPNTILIEVGGQYNNIEEVNNSLKVFASIIYDYLKGEEWKKRKIGF